MNASTAGALIGLAAALAVGWSLAGPSGNGVVLGFLSGAALTGAALVWQRHELAQHPERLFLITVCGFLAKLVAMFAGAVCLRYWEAAAQLFDWKSFLIAFGASAILISIPGTIENVRKLTSLRPQQSSHP